MKPPCSGRSPAVTNCKRRFLYKQTASRWICLIGWLFHIVSQCANFFMLFSPFLVQGLPVYFLQFGERFTDSAQPDPAVPEWEVSLCTFILHPPGAVNSIRRNDARPPLLFGRCCFCRPRRRACRPIARQCRMNSAWSFAGFILPRCRCTCKNAAAEPRAVFSVVFIMHVHLCPAWRRKQP